MQHNSPSGLAFFALYGEPDAQGDPDFVHIEDIRVRSRLYDWRITPHAHPRMFQIVVLLGGTAEVQIDRELHHIEAPGVVCLPGSVVHGFVFEPESVGWVVTVSELLLAEAGETPEDQRGLGLIRPVLERPRILSLTDEPEMKAQMGAYLEQMHSEFHQIRLGHATMVHWLLRAVLILVRRRLETEDSLVGGEGRRRVQFARFRQLVETHFKEHWPVEAYADALALSQARLNRLCRGVAGKGPNALIQDRLVLEAQRHLIFTSASAAMIAYELGFQDPAYFSRFFKRRTGLAPGQFRAEKLAELQG